MMSKNWQRRMTMMRTVTMMTMMRTSNDDYDSVNSMNVIQEEMERKAMSAGMKSNRKRSRGEIMMRTIQYAKKRCIAQTNKIQEKQ